MAVTTYFSHFWYQKSDIFWSLFYSVFQTNSVDHEGVLRIDAEVEFRPDLPDH